MLKLILVVVLGFIALPSFAKACADLTGSYVYENCGLQFVQKDCTQLDISSKCSNADVETEHVVIGQVNQREGEVEVWTWNGEKLEFQRQFVNESHEVNKTVNVEYYLDSGKNLLQNESVNWTNGPSINFETKKFDRVSGFTF